MTFAYPVVVRWSDIDSYDHVNNVRYFDYLQEARIAFLDEVFGSEDAGFFESSPCVLASQSVDYVKPILLRHPPYTVRVWVQAVGNSSYTLGSRIEDDDAVYAKAVSVLVGVDPVTHAKRNLSDAERAALLGHLT